MDADLIGRKKHRFPNLACMKISGYFKKNNNKVVLKTDYINLDEFDKVFISKVFTDTPIETSILDLPNVEYGGTGFYYDMADPLPKYIEHCFPDYHLYDDWIESRIAEGVSRAEFRYYTDYSIGYLTRGCFRHCSFCINQKYNKVSEHSPLEEFLDNDRKKICLLDDNFLGCPNWKELLLALQNTNKPFQFKQGLDERLLTDEKCEILFNSRYDDRFLFAFDDIDDREIIENKLQLLRKYTDKVPKFYVLCGYDKRDVWDNEFWRMDLLSLFERIRILSSYKCLPYIMRFNRYNESQWKGVYIATAAWCNQPNVFWNNTLREYATKKSALRKNCIGAELRYITKAIGDIPELEPYFDMKFSEMKG